METPQPSAATEIFRALGDPVRWSILAQIAAVDELPCAELERSLSVSKPTISYHTKVLQQAGLLAVRKEGRNYFYVLRREALRGVQDEIRRLMPAPKPKPEPKAAKGPGATGTGPSTGDDELVVLTW